MMTPEFATPTRVMTTIVTGSIAILLYLLASLLLTLRLAHCYSGPGCHRSQILAISGIAVLLHAILVYPSIMTPHGLDLALFNAASLICLISAALLMLASDVFLRSAVGPDEQRLQVTAPSDVSFSTLLALLDAARLAGFSELSLAVGSE